MGALFRCTACTKEMVIERYHLGRTVPCPWCRATNQTPRQMDFDSIDQARIRDESKGGTLLVLAVLGFFTLCLPLSAWVWWSAQGVLARAADDGRHADGLVRAARGLAIVGTLVQAVILLLVLAAWAF